MNPLSIMGGTGFILGRYAQLYPNESVIEARDTLAPSQEDVLYGISTTSNYAPLLGDLTTDIETNLLHLAKVLPNVRGTFNHLSSWFVYAGADHGHHPAWRAKEHHLSSPNGFYSITKLASEQLIRSYVETAALDECLYGGPSAYRILRLSNVIGNDPRAGKQKNAFEYLLKLVLANEDVPIYEGTCYRDILHVDDTCRAIRACMEAGEATLNQVINIGRGESHRMEELIAYAIAQTGSSSQIVRVPVPPFHQVVQVPDIFLDTTKLRVLGWEPQYTVWQSIDRVIEGLTRRA